MRTKIEKILNLTTFFKIKQSNKYGITCSLEKPSQIVLQNIHKNWLQSIYAKTHQNFPVYLIEHIIPNKINKNVLSFGYIKQCLRDEAKEIVVEYDDENCTLKNNSELSFSVTIPQQDIMQYFSQWQRYRKYWWSSITTTPGLFSVIDMTYEDNNNDDNTYANISANFDWGQWIVENIKVTSSTNNSKNSSLLSCTISLEKTLITLLLDATENSTKEGYLRLHNKMTPYKISFALDHKEETNISTLQDLAKQMFYKLHSNKISTWLPKFTLPLDLQIKENLKMGVTYTAILSDATLSNGIFHLMNSSTMLKEQVHVADFVNYSALLCGKRMVS